MAEKALSDKREEDSFAGKKRKIQQLRLQSKFETQSAAAAAEINKGNVKPLFYCFCAEEAVYKRQFKI